MIIKCQTEWKLNTDSIFSADKYIKVQTSVELLSSIFLISIITVSHMRQPSEDLTESTTLGRDLITLAGERGMALRMIWLLDTILGLEEVQKPRDEQRVAGSSSVARSSNNICPYSETVVSHWNISTDMFLYSNLQNVQPFNKISKQIRIH